MGVLHCGAVDDDVGRHDLEQAHVFPIFVRAAAARERVRKSAFFVEEIARVPAGRDDDDAVGCRLFF